MIVPMIEHLASSHFMPHHSRNEGIFVFTLAVPSSVVSLSRFFVCFNTSVTANIPIKTGIISSPAISSPLPNVSLCTAYIGSCPTHASRSPKSPEINVRKIFLLSRHVNIDSPMNVIAKISDGLNDNAACVNCGDNVSIARAETSPPIADEPNAIPSAFPASPRCAIG